MSDEKNDQPQETPKETKSQELRNENKPQEGPKETKIIQLNESFAGKSQPGDQGILLNPVGSHNTDPFVSQDTPASPATSTPQTTTTPSAPVPVAQADTSSSDE